LGCSTGSAEPEQAGRGSAGSSADSVVSFDWQTSERLLVGPDDAKKAAPFWIKMRESEGR
jgi:hypothetical protein